MTPKELQEKLGVYGHPVVVDGKIGPATRKALIEVFTNTCAPAIDGPAIQALAYRLGCSEQQVRAVAKVESGGSGFDKKGRPKILFERHIFHRLTNGHHSPTSFSMLKGGGYKEDSWDKLGLALAKNVDAAFKSASWGKFQVMGMHSEGLGYASPFEMAYSAVTSEAAHYEMLARYIEFAKLLGAMRRLSTNPEDNRAFARGYNGPAYERFDYHNKLAKAMR